MEAGAADVVVARGDVVLGPLHGVPVTVKDWIDVEGFPCARARAFPIVTGAPSGRDSGEATARRGCDRDREDRRRDDNEMYGGTHNPHDHRAARAGAAAARRRSSPRVHRRSVSAATAAAASAGRRRGAASRGSSRRRAAVPNIGHFPRIGALHDGRTQIGPLARNIDDLALALGVIAGFDGIDPGVVAVPLGSAADVVVASLRVAWFTHDDPGHPSDAVAEHVELAVRALADAGATVVDDAVPAHLAEALDITLRYWGRRQLSGTEADDLLWDWDRFRRRQLVFA